MVRSIFDYASTIDIQDLGEDNFVFSLSDRGDDLSQWRSYSDDGRGFTIGFDSEALAGYARATGSFSFGQVIYSRTTYRRRVSSILNKFAELEGLDEIGAEEQLEVAEDLATLIHSAACSFKHSSFRSESEWRINCYPDTDEDIQVRIGRIGLVPYLSLALHADPDTLPITKIGIGPGFKDSSAQYAIEKLCAQFGIAPEIYRADTPYPR